MKRADLEKIKDYALSGEDLQKLVGKIRFIKYPDLDQETIQSVFRPRKEVIVLFLTQDRYTGHWICVLEHPTTIEVFDSYGLDPDGHRGKISDQKRDALDQNEPQMMDLFSRDPTKKVIWNTKKLQAPNTATCGRHVAVRIMHRDMDLDRYLQLVEGSGMNPDDYVTMITYEKLKK